MNYMHRTRLAQPVHASYALLQPSWVPRGFKIYHYGSCLQVEPNASRVGRKEDLAFRIVAESLDQGPPLAGGNSAMKGYKSNSQFAQLLPRQKCHPLILAEYHNFAILLDGEFSENLTKLLEFG